MERTPFPSNHDNLYDRVTEELQRERIAFRRRTFRDDLADFIKDLLYDPWFSAIVFGLGFAAGTLTVLGLAELIAVLKFGGSL